MKSWARDVSLPKNFDEGNRRLRNDFRGKPANLVGFSLQAPPALYQGTA
jgi:hypothetical protein